MSKKRASKVAELRKCFRRAAAPLTIPAVAIGVDVTWFGGSGKKSEVSSRMECIAHALKTNQGWGPPEFQRVRLSGFKDQTKPTEANSDPNGKDLLSGLEQVFEKYKPLGNVVVALDAPLMALDRGLADRSKKQKKGEVKRRGCDDAWAASVSLSPNGWKQNVNIQPGAPVPSRITAIVKELTRKGFKLYITPDLPLSDRVLIECFPNQVIWSAGVLEHCGESTFRSMVAYKAMGKHKTVLPLRILRDVCSHTLRPCLEVAGLNVHDWLSSFWKWLTTEQVIVGGIEGVTGKSFDDAVDSMLSLIAAVAFVDGNSHLHQGENPLDGHIIGPGFPKERKQDDPSVAFRQLSLVVLDGTFAICRLGSDSSLPPWATVAGLYSFTRTADELSIVCRQDAVPDAIQCERGWLCLRVAGTISLLVVGVIASLTAPLAEAGISVFAISTFDTDYLLVREDDFENAIAVLERAGHSITK